MKFYDRENELNLLKETRKASVHSAKMTILSLIAGSKTSRTEIESILEKRWAVT
jgi:hypothetical protein